MQEQSEALGPRHDESATSAKLVSFCGGPTRRKQTGFIKCPRERARAERHRSERGRA
jgi:hypothetical protein